MKSSPLNKNETTFKKLTVKKQIVYIHKKISISTYKHKHTL